ncbi:MAG: hypothetical protein H0U66_07330 [Gemmatimonadaceae bacterium]|nr:hypothetical protein [Gemmatimonadaceae bacterium]
MYSRIGNVITAALLALTVTAARAAAQGGPPAHISQQEVDFRQGLTPDTWAKNADGMARCAVTSAGSDLVDLRWSTDSLDGTVSLPKDFHEEPVSAGADGKRWVGADSTSVEIHGTHALYRGNMGMGGMDIGRPLGTTTCALTLEGRPAPTHTLMLTRPAHGDTLYVDTPNTVIRNGVGLQFIVLTNSPAREAKLLAAVQSLKVVQRR